MRTYGPAVLFTAVIATACVIYLLPPKAAVAVMIGAGIGFVWWITRPRHCCLCQIRPAVLEMADYPLCRKCWSDVDQKARLAEDLSKNVATKEIDAYLAQLPRTPRRFE
jgi:hypothetical protein